MTLIAGIKCVDGDVICSDSQETVGDLRSSAEKLDVWTEGNVGIAIAGSGDNGELIDSFVERLRDELANNQNVNSLKTLKDLIQVEMRQFQLDEAASYSKSERRMRFVIGARLLSTNERAFWSSKANSLKAIQAYDLIGFGDERYRFAMEAYLNPNPRPTIAQGIFLGLYVMWLGEQTSNYVKSPVHIAVVKDGLVIREPQQKIDALFQRVKLFSAQFDKLFLSCPDTGLQHADFSNRMREFVSTIVQLRQDYVVEWVGHAVDTGLDRIIEQWNLVPTGTTIVLDAQNAEHLRIQQMIADALRQNEDGKQSRDKLLFNLGTIVSNRRKRLLKYVNPDNFPVEELSPTELGEDQRAYLELDAAGRMGPFKVSQEIVNVVQRVVYHITNNLMFGEQIELQLQCIAAQQAIAFIERNMPPE